MDTRLHTKRGDVTRYGLACGYTQTWFSKDCESYVRLEQISSNGALRVVSMGKYLREFDFFGMSLKEARRIARKALKTLPEREATATADWLSNL